MYGSCTKIAVVNRSTLNLYGNLILFENNKYFYQNYYDNVGLNIMKNEILSFFCDSDIYVDIYVFAIFNS